MKLTKPLIIVLAGLVSIVNLAPAADARNEKKPAAEKKEAKPFKNVRVAGFEKLRADRKNVVLDVRSKEEYAAGHIAGAVNIDVNAPDFEEKVSKLDKNTLIWCIAPPEPEAPRRAAR